MSQHPRNLAVGSTLEQAAETFGGLFTDVELTTYAEVGGHLDLGLLGSLSLVSGTSSDELLPGIVAQHGALGPAAPPVFVGRAGSVTELLPGAAPAALLPVSPGPLSPSGGGHRQEAGGTTGTGTEPPERARPGTRQLLAGGLAAVLLALVVVALVGAVGGLSWALLVLGLEILGAQVLLLAGLGYVTVLLRRHVAADGDEQRFREDLTHRSGRLLEQGRENIARQRRRFDSVDRGLADLRGTRDRVDALTRLVSREHARVDGVPDQRDLTGDRESS